MSAETTEVRRGLSTWKWDSVELLDWLFRTKRIRLKRSWLFDTSPLPMPKDFDFSRVEEMIRGVMYGDMLGNTTEGMRPAERKKRYGEIRSFLPNKHAGYRRVGTASDDTQLTLRTLEHVMEEGRVVPEKLADRLEEWPIYGIGTTTTKFLANRKKGLPWYLSGVTEDAASNGALMRIAPVIIPHLMNPSPALWADVAIAAMVTHNDAASIGSCLAFTYLLWECLRCGVPKEPTWWVVKFCGILASLEGDTRYRPRKPGVNYCGPLWLYTKACVTNALEKDLSVLDACEGWYSGAYLLETVPSVLYILARHAHEPKEAIVRAVNDTKDNDTIAAIVGSLSSICTR
jgi:ADP-ribosylglycohydrolase